MRLFCRVAVVCRIAAALSFALVSLPVFAQKTPARKPSALKPLARKLSVALKSPVPLHARLAAHKTLFPSKSSRQTPPAASTSAARTLTIDEAVALALKANPTVQLSQTRLSRAQEQIGQVDAQGRPQIRADVADTLSSNLSFSTVSGALTNPSVPGGGQIPVIIDQGGGGAIGGTSGGISTNVSGTGSGTAATASTSGSSGGTTTGGGTTGGTGGVSATPSLIQQYPNITVRDPKADPVTTIPTTTQTINRGKRNNYSGRLSATQYIDLFGLLPAARDVVKTTRDFYVLDLERVSNETAYNAKTSYFSVLRNQALVGVQQELVDAATESVRIAQVKFTAGAGAQFDVVSAQTTLSNAQQALSQAQNQLELSRASLNNTLGQPQETPIAVTAPPLPPLDQQFTLEDNLQKAYAGRPESRQADSNLVIAKRLIKLAGATLLPTFGLVAGANYNGTSSTNSSQTTETITAQIGIPLYDGGTTHSRVRSARLDLDTQNTTRNQLRQNVALEVRQAISNITNAQSRAQSSQQGVTQAQEALRLANVRFQNGRGTFLEVTNAQAQLVQARSNLLNAQFDYQASLAQLTRATGGR